MAHFLFHFALTVVIGVACGSLLVSWQKHTHRMARDKAIRERMKQRILQDVIQREPVSK